MPVLVNRWENIPAKRRSDSAMIDLMVKPLMELVTSSSDDVATMSTNMFFELLKAEFNEFQDFKQIGRHAVDAIDDIMRKTNSSQSNEGDKLRTLFDVDLRKKFESDPVLQCEAAQGFLNETTELFELLSHLNHYPKRSEFEDERMYAYTKLMDFLGRLQRYDSYIKYAHQMAKELSALGLHTESACALLLYAKLLRCDFQASSSDSSSSMHDLKLEDQGIESQTDDFIHVREMMEAAVGAKAHCHGDCDGPNATTVLEELDLVGIVYPEQTSYQRREEIYMRAMESFDRGQQWEMAIELANALIRQFSTVTHEYEKLSALLRRVADWCVHPCACACDLRLLQVAAGLMCGG